MTWIMQQLRQICFFLDNIVYSLIEKVYELFMYLANVDLISHNSVFDELVTRVYLILGIFMLFKVSFSIIQYMVDPNAFSEKGKGFGKLITNAMVSIVLLAATPFIFDKAYELQGLIVGSNVINNLLLGSESEDYISTNENNQITITDNITNMAKDLQFSLFGAFYTLNTKADVGIPECDPKSTGKNSNIIGSVDMVLAEPQEEGNRTCLEAFAEDARDEFTRYKIQLEDIFKYIPSGEDENHANIEDHRDFSKLGGLLYWQKEADTEFTITYYPLVSTLTGGYLAFLLITFCIDVAARAIKLLFLQAVAPIAIISYIDPKESAGNSKLMNWAKNCLTTYGSLFLRIAIIFLAIRIVEMITSMFFWPDDDNYISYYLSDANGNVQDSANASTMNVFVYVFLILGVFTFAKQVPKMIETIFGIKGSGEMSLNPFKSISQNAGATALIGGAAGLGASAISTAGMARQLYKGKGALGALKGARDIVGGTLSGAVGGTVKGFTSQGKGYVGKGVSQGGRTAWNMMERNNKSLRNRARDRWSDITGTPYDSFLDSQKVAKYKQTTEDFEAMKKAHEDFSHTDAGRKIDLDGKGHNLEYFQFQEQAMKKRYEDSIKNNLSESEQETAYDNYKKACKDLKENQIKFGDEALKLGIGTNSLESMNRQSSENTNMDSATYDGSVIDSYEKALKLATDASKASDKLQTSDNFRDNAEQEGYRERQSRVGFQKSNTKNRQ